MFIIYQYHAPGNQNSTYPSQFMDYLKIKTKEFSNLVIDFGYKELHTILIKIIRPWPTNSKFS